MKKMRISRKTLHRVFPTKKENLKQWTRRKERGLDFQRKASSTLGQKFQQDSWTRQAYSYGLYSRRLLSFLFGGVKHGITPSYIRNLFTHLSQVQPGPNALLSSLERRLDLSLYSLSFASTVKESRHLIQNQKVWVNGRMNTYPSSLLFPGDMIQVCSSVKLEGKPKLGKTPLYWEVDYALRSALFLSLPTTFFFSCHIERELKMTCRNPRHFS